MTDAGAYWLYEAGIGEERAALIEGGKIVEARIERDGGLKAGLVSPAKLVKKLGDSGRAIATLDSGEEVLLSSVPTGITEGSELKVEIVREAIAEKQRQKWPLAKATDKPAAPAPSLQQQLDLTGFPVTLCHAHDADRLAEAGWSELLEEAASGHVAFPGGSLDISVTPAMTLIDIDGDIGGRALAMAGAAASAKAIRRLGLQGSIGIDFPQVESKAARQDVVQAFDDTMQVDCERTAINGFGFIQIVTRRLRPSLCEIWNKSSRHGYALSLLRAGERDRQTGRLQIVCHPGLAAFFKKRGFLLEELSRRSGREVSLRVDTKIAIGGEYVENA